MAERTRYTAALEKTCKKDQTMKKTMKKNKPRQSSKTVETQQFATVLIEQALLD